MGALLDVREGERKMAIGALLTLFLVTAGHVVLEAARDALFLSRIPVSRLPWVYLAIAALGFALSRELPRRKVGGSRALPFAMATAAVVTSGFWAASFSASAWLFYALYLWSGLFASWALLQVWLAFVSGYTVAQAKRLFGFIGSGTILGAVAGSAAALALVSAMRAEHLLLAAAGLFLAAAAPCLLLRSPKTAATVPGGESAREDVADVWIVLRDPFIRRVLGLVLLSALTFTFVDYLFKRAVYLEVPKEKLGSFFAAMGMVLNLAALVAQVVGVGWILRRFGVSRAIAVLPILLACGAIGAFALGGIQPTLLLRGIDGTLRSSLSRTTTEILYVPIAEARRARVKSFIDLAGQRGGQALASLVILLMVKAGSGERSLAVAIIVLSCGWLLVALGIRRPYLDLFRTTLREGRIDYQGQLPALDRGALEVLFAALSSPKVPEVLAALDLLAVHELERLIPPLILYHPSSKIVLRALELLAKQKRTDFVPIADWLNGHADVQVRVAALRARMTVDPSETVLRERLVDGCPEVSATALIGLASHEELMTPKAAQDAVYSLASDPSPAVRVALARAIRERPRPCFAGVLERLAGATEPEVIMEVARAMGRMRSAQFLPALVRLLARRHEGPAAGDALLDFGDVALAYLARCLADRETPPSVRATLPRAIARFEPARAAPVLLARLVDDPDGTVRFRILRALCYVRDQDPKVPLDEGKLHSAAHQALRAALRDLDWRTALERAKLQDPRRATRAFALLTVMMRDRESDALARLFRILGLLFPAENFVRIHRGLHSDAARLRSSSRELVESVVAPPLRQPILALVEDLADAQRLARAAPYYVASPLGYVDVLRAVRARGDELANVVDYHAAEMGIALPRGADTPSHYEFVAAIGEARTDPRVTQREDDRGI